MLILGIDKPIQKRMKNLKYFLFAIAISILCVGAVAQTNNQSTSNNGGRATLRLGSKSSDLKRAPSNVCIEIIYCDGAVCMVSEQDDIALYLEFKNTVTGEVESLPYIMPGESVSIDLIQGEYELIAEMIDGRTFYGIMLVV